MKRLIEIQKALQSKARLGEGTAYWLPRSWTGDGAAGEVVAVNPYRFYAARIGEILERPARLIPPLPAEEWSRKAVCYNAFVRLFSAFDHDRDGRLAVPANASGWRETGTFLKTIALLPHIQGLGADTLHLLPITTIGQDGKKGALGSPYAIRNPVELDEGLAEPELGLGAEAEFEALMQAAHHLGMRVVLEFVFRTAAKDCDWVAEHPEWFYWVRRSLSNRAPGRPGYGAPVFDAATLARVKSSVQRHDFEDLPPPPADHRGLFSAAPAAGRVFKEDGRWVGKLEQGEEVRVAGAFADWPPDDPQPPWDDVTYLKLYSHPEYDYIAYNTVRMYDRRLSRPENVQSELWERLIAVVPHYQQRFAIDGVMLDMGHALPLSLLEGMVAAARAADPHFAFWEESFSPTWDSRRHGYTAAVGYLWHDVWKPNKAWELVRRYAHEKLPLPFFGTAENHNTPRAAAHPGGPLFSRHAWAYVNFLPVVPFLHNGFELGERRPVNTGLNFSPAEQEKFPAGELALFSAVGLDWLRPDGIQDWVRQVSAVRREYRDLLADPDPSTFQALDSSPQGAYAFWRRNAAASLLLAGNWNMEFPAQVEVPVASGALEDLMSGEMLSAREGAVRIALARGEARMFKALPTPSPRA